MFVLTCKFPDCCEQHKSSSRSWSWWYGRGWESGCPGSAGCWCCWSRRVVCQRRTSQHWEWVHQTPDHEHGDATDCPHSVQYLISAYLAVDGDLVTRTRGNTLLINTDDWSIWNNENNNILVSTGQHCSEHSHCTVRLRWAESGWPTPLSAEHVYSPLSPLVTWYINQLIIND